MCGEQVGYVALYGRHPVYAVQLFFAVDTPTRLFVISEQQSTYPFTTTKGAQQFTPMLDYKVLLTSTTSCA
jgi:hypothetical protein